jgi:hypothetical protein
MIIWPDLFTTVFGGGVLAICSLIYSVCCKINRNMDAFAKHISECEIRTQNHIDLHDAGKEDRQEIRRRLELLEAVARLGRT